MNRTSPTTDLFTLIGMMATIAGILLCLFFLFTPLTFGAVETNDVIGRSPDLDISMRWIQPVLGLAIVEDALIRQRCQEPAADTSVTGQTANPGPGSIQWVLGRVIVELSRSRMVSGLSAVRRQENDERIVSIARHTAEQFQEGPGAEGRMTAPAILTF